MTSKTAHHPRNSLRATHNGQQFCDVDCDVAPTSNTTDYLVLPRATVYTARPTTYWRLDMLAELVTPRDPVDWHFPSARLQPLGHLSVPGAEIQHRFLIVAYRRYGRNIKERRSILLPSTAVPDSFECPSR